MRDWWAVGAAFAALVAYNAMQIGIYGLFGVAMGAFMAWSGSTSNGGRGA